MSIGSTTKLMTALVTLENAKLSQTFTASDYRPLPIESQIRLLPGERMKVSDLMRGLLLESGNDAAVTLAEGVSGSRKKFVREMNRRARGLELKNTHFANEIGLDEEGNYSSARDLVTLAKVLRTNAFFKKVVDTPVGTLKSGDHERTFRNRNKLVSRYSWVNGVKTGHTRGAGYVLVGSGSKQRHPAHHRGARHRRRSRPRQRHDGAAELGAPEVPAHPRGGRGQGHGQGPDPRSPGRDAQPGA